MDILRRHSKTGRWATHLEKAWHHSQSAVHLAARDQPNPPRRSHKLQNRFTAEEMAAMASAYCSGALIHEIAEEHSTTDYAVSSVLQQCQVGIRLQRITEEETQRAVCGYHQGQSIYQIAADLGRAFATVRSALIKEGVLLRPSVKPTKLTEQEITEAVAAYQAGSSLKDLSLQFGVAVETVRRALQARIRLRPRNGHGRPT